MHPRTSPAFEAFNGRPFAHGTERFELRRPAPGRRCQGPAVSCQLDRRSPVAALTRGIWHNRRLPAKRLATSAADDVTSVRRQMANDGGWNEDSPSGPKHHAFFATEVSKLCPNDFHPELTSDGVH